MNGVYAIKFLTIEDKRILNAVIKAWMGYGFKSKLLPASFTGHHHPRARIWCVITTSKSTHRFLTIKFLVYGDWLLSDNMRRYAKIIGLVKFALFTPFFTRLVNVNLADAPDALRTLLILNIPPAQRSFTLKNVFLNIVCAPYILSLRIA